MPMNVAKILRGRLFKSFAVLLNPAFVQVKLVVSDTFDQGYRSIK